MEPHLTLRRAINIRQTDVVVALLNCAVVEIDVT